MAHEYRGQGGAIIPGEWVSRATAALIDEHYHGSMSPEEVAIIVLEAVLPELRGWG